VLQAVLALPLRRKEKKAPGAAGGAVPTLVSMDTN